MFRTQRKLFSLLLIASAMSLTVGCQKAPQKIVTECGGGAKFACPSNMFCDLGSNCGGFDSVGQCRRIPSECPEENDPNKQVCSCTNKTFSSACYSHASGLSIAYTGNCIQK